MSEQTEPESSRVPFYRYLLAVLACTMTAAACFGLAIVLIVFVFGRVEDWVDRQVWLLRIALQIVLGLGAIVAIGGAWAVTVDVWHRITKPQSAVGEGQKYGRHAKWYPGRPKDTSIEGEGEHGHCPQCQFSYGWNGHHCSHCGYSNAP